METRGEVVTRAMLLAKCALLEAALEVQQGQRLS